MKILETIDFSNKEHISFEVYVKYKDKEYVRNESAPRENPSVGFYFWLENPNTNNTEPGIWSELEKEYQKELIRSKRREKLDRIKDGNNIT